MIKVMWIGGNHPRHLYYINMISEKFNLCGAIIETRENIMPDVPDGLEQIDKKNFIRHFQNRFDAEEKFFGSQNIPDCPVLKISEENLNSLESVEFVKKQRPDLVMIFGCGLVKSPLFDVLPNDTVNLHLGLSPRYRGSATLFWPFYFLEPNYAGSTFHYIVSEPDAGNIIHHVVPQLEINDGIHDVACKTVIESADAAIKLLEIYESGNGWKAYKQRGTGKNFLTNDFMPQHLRVIYNIYDDDIVRHYLEGRLKPKIPKLISQF